MKLNQKEFEIKYTPTSINEFYPSTDLSIFSNMINQKLYPQRMVFYGPPGVGKTTLARMIGAYILELTEEDRKSLIYGRRDFYCSNFIEVDFARNSSSEYVQSICDKLISVATSSEGLFGHQKWVFLFDEFTQLVQQTQKKLIKSIGDDKDIDNLFIIVTTNDIYKLEPSFTDRQTRYEFKEPEKRLMEMYVKDILRKENAPADNIQIERIIERANYSFRSLASTTWEFLINGGFPQPVVQKPTVIVDFIRAINRISSEIANNIKQNNSTRIDFDSLQSGYYQQLVSAIENLENKPPTTIYKLFEFYIKVNLKKSESKYKDLFLAGIFMEEISTLRNLHQKEVDTGFELFRIAHRCINHRVRYFLEYQEQQGRDNADIKSGHNSMVLGNNDNQEMPRE